MDWVNIGKKIFWLKNSYSNGDKYYGEWKNDKRSGTGECRFGNNNVFFGSWKDNKMTGFGEMVYSNGNR